MKKPIHDMTFEELGARCLKAEEEIRGLRAHNTTQATRMAMLQLDLKHRDGVIDSLTRKEEPK